MENVCIGPFFLSEDEKMKSLGMKAMENPPLLFVVCSRVNHPCVSRKRKKKLTFPIRIFFGFDFRRLIILFSAKSQNYFSTHFLTRRDPIHSAALTTLSLVLISRAD